MGTCEQRDTGQEHPDKTTGQRTDDYLQIHDHFFFWNCRIIIIIIIVVVVVKVRSDSASDLSLATC